MAKILIVEDSEPVANMYQRQLEADGHKVVRAANGKIGLAKVKSENPDLVLLDIILPEISGLDFLAKIQSSPDTKKIPVVAVSAFGSEENQKKALELGSKEFIEKENVNPSDVVKIVNKYL